MSRHRFLGEVVVDVAPVTIHSNMEGIFSFSNILHATQLALDQIDDVLGFTHCCCSDTKSIASAIAGKHVTCFDDRTRFAMWTKTLATPLVNL